MRLTKEAKFNLVFLVVLLLASLPGLVILIRKKLDPEARRMSEAPYVRRTEAYNNPLPAATSSRRIVPPVTARWVESLANQKLGAPPLRYMAAGGREEPVLSEGRRFELLGIRQTHEGSTLIVLAWLGELGRGEVDLFEAQAESLGALQSVEVDQIDVPQEVISELKDEGYVVPPARVGLLWLRFAGARSPADATWGPRIRLTWRSPRASGEDVLDLARALPAGGPAAKDDVPVPRP